MGSVQRPGGMGLTRASHAIEMSDLSTAVGSLCDWRWSVAAWVFVAASVLEGDTPSGSPCGPAESGRRPTRGTCC